MTFKIRNLSVRVDFLFTAIVALLIAIDRQGIIYLSLVSVAVHESGHIAATLLLGGKITRLYLSPCGIILHKDYNDSKAVCILIASAGPAFNLTPALFMKNCIFKYIMMINGMFNLIPVFGTDGGDIVKLICDTLFKTERSDRIFFGISSAVSVAFLVAGAMMFFYFKNPTLFAAAVYLCIMTIMSVIR